MRQIIKDFVALTVETLPVQEPVYEFGSFQVPSQIGFADLRAFFPGKDYIGCDMREGPGVDKILDLHKIDLPDASVGTVLLLDTIEHVEFPRKALSELHRILKTNGLLIMSSVMQFPIHDYPFDYWRFTPKAFESLLAGFSDIYVTFAGKVDFPHTVVGIGVKNGGIQNKNEFIQKCATWQKECEKYNLIHRKIARFISCKIRPPR